MIYYYCMAMRTYYHELSAQIGVYHALVVRSRL